MTHSRTSTPREIVILSAAKNPRISLLLLLVVFLAPPARAQSPETIFNTLTQQTGTQTDIAAHLQRVQAAQHAGVSAQGKPTGQAIYTLTEQFLAAAPKRFNGSPGHLAAEEFIKAHFKPEAAKGNLETDAFTAQTPVGPQTLRNYIVRFPGRAPRPGETPGVIVLATHYETNYPLKDTAFVGANDGACTSALLIALGEYLRTHPPEGYAVWLVFDDGEEDVSNPPYTGRWGTSTNLYGTRHLAAKWSSDGTLPRIKAFLLADMIGDKDLNINRDDQSTPWLEDLLAQAARNTGHSSAIFKNPLQGLADDHIPFKQRGVPVLDLIDIDYGPHTAALPDGYHHTPQDTLDKLSPRSLQTSADLILEVIRLINRR